MQHNNINTAFSQNCSVPNILFRNCLLCENKLIKCRRGSATLRINNNWLVTENGVENRPITENPDLLLSSNVNIDFEAQSIGRVDFKINESGFAYGIFTERDLIFLRMNGNHAYPRLVDFIAKEARMLPNFAKSLPITKQWHSSKITRISQTHFRLPSSKQR